MKRELPDAQARSHWYLSNQGELLLHQKTNTEYLQRYDSRVVADNFKFGADKNIIVALEHNVLVANKKDMAKVLNMTSISEVVIKANLS